MISMRQTTISYTRLITQSSLTVQLGWQVCGGHAPYLYSTESLALFRVPHRNTDRFHKQLHMSTQ
uniref:Uncharacterized protein n=1 Tax=Anguilla anguilla TaxID=7936 RepID=A0A0E9VHR3_ANGAN